VVLASEESRLESQFFRMLEKNLLLVLFPLPRQQSCNVFKHIHTTTPVVAARLWTGIEKVGGESSCDNQPHEWSVHEAGGTLQSIV
jgi:hypothetical protein